uniref:Uncharacterized protein MANES_11G013700 n=1 Tax=Rhizophora mucronata TaxID=61149 RepID=A0A2P2JFP8_RHIMU
MTPMSTRTRMMSCSMSSLLLSLLLLAVTLVSLEVPQL